MGNGIFTGTIQAITITKKFNNVIYDHRGGGLTPGAFSPAQRKLITHNIIYKNALDVKGYETTNVFTTNLIGVDSLFINPAAGDFHLQAGSSASRYSTTLIEVTFDFDYGAWPGRKIIPPAGFKDVLDLGISILPPGMGAVDFQVILPGSSRCNLPVAFNAL